jgi:Zn-dependent M28 family amino/carboxypeptidase
MRKLILVSAVMFCTAATAQKSADKFAKTITQEDLRKQLTIIASDEMEGRETATEGQRKAAAYIESEFKRMGLKPGNGSSYQQQYPVYQDTLTTASLKIYNYSFDFDRQFTVSLNNTVNGSWNLNEVVFASFGITDSTRNDYKDLDVKDKWVMVIEGTPADIDKTEMGNNVGAGFRMGAASLISKMQTAKAKGAKGLLLVSKSFLNEKRNPTNTKGNMYLNKPKASDALPAISISYQAAASILTKQLSNFADLKNVKTGLYNTQTSVTTNKQTNNLQSSNVMGLLEGTDKKDEYVVLTAHYDHLGKRDGVIYYGADDDGSGTVSVIEMAEAFVAAAKKGKGPRRSIVFMTVSGEEKGLWGSEYYTNNPVYPLAKTSVNLNTDMVGRRDPAYKGDSTNYVYVIGEDKLSSDLMPITDAVNATAKMELDRRYNDLKDPNRFYYRSDHYNFAKNGVPIIFYFDGVHKDYHRPTDTVEKINFDLMEKRVRLIFNTAWLMANRDEMLKRDIKLAIPSRG